MLHPSYSDLIKVVNQDVEPGEEKIVNSRYSIVMATAKRARQIIAGHEPMVRIKPGRSLSPSRWRSSDRERSRFWVRKNRKRNRNRSKED